MFVFFLVVALIAGAVLLALDAHERIEGLVLVDKATGATVLEDWSILVQHSVIVGILATVLLLLALAIGLFASQTPIRLALRHHREWLDRTYGDHQLGIARDECMRLDKELAATQRQLVAVKGQRAGIRRSLRTATRERDRMRRATNAERSRADGAALALRDLLHRPGAGGASAGGLPQPAPGPRRKRSRAPPRSGSRRSGRDTVH